MGWRARQANDRHGSLLIGIALLGLGACGQATPEPEPLPPDLPVQVTYDYHTTQTKGGVLEWELWGETAERYPGDDALTLQGVRMVFYREGQRDAVLTSRSGEIDEKTQQTVARGDVVVISGDGKRLESEILYWDPQRRLIHTEAFVRFIDGDQVLTGYGMETDPNLTTLVLRENVSGEFGEEAPGERGDGP
jgi:LPS export ABC transporter protein LptC